jgi:hypothetical protein
MEGMTDHDESLEIGIAAGLDIPSAMIISEQEKEPHKPTGKGCSPTVLAILVGLIFLVYFL